MTIQAAFALSLRKLLVIDAATCLLMGAALYFASDAIAGALAVPASFVWWAGAILFPCAILMGVAAVPSTTSPALGWLVVLGNVGWVAASLAVVFFVLSPNLLGSVFILAQAMVVAAMAVLEYRAMPRAAPASFA